MVYIIKHELKCDGNKTRYKMYKADKHASFKLKLFLKQLQKKLFVERKVQGQQVDIQTFFLRKTMVLYIYLDSDF